jgi:hypothetical protein
MKRLSGALGALALCVLLLVAATTASGAPPRAQLHAFACHRALDPPDRSIAVTAVMRPLPGTQHLSLRFDLLMSEGASMPQKVIRSGDLGVWITPTNPTLGQLPGDVWNLQKSVVELAAPASYRFRVEFRWTGAHGRVLGSTVLYSGRCRQRELRPDLLVSSIAVTAIPNNPNKDLYTALIANAGNSAAGPFDVLFAPADGSAPKTHTVALLAAHASRTEAFVGPLCTAASAPTITVDSAREVDDLNRANNALTATCPASGSA